MSFVGLPSVTLRHSALSKSSGPGDEEEVSLGLSHFLLGRKESLPTWVAKSPPATAQLAQLAPKYLAFPQTSF